MPETEWHSARVSLRGKKTTESLTEERPKTELEKSTTGATPGQGEANLRGDAKKKDQTQPATLGQKEEGKFKAYAAAASELRRGRKGRGEDTRSKRRSNSQSGGWKPKWDIQVFSLKKIRREALSASDFGFPQGRGGGGGVNS